MVLCGTVERFGGCPYLRRSRFSRDLEFELSRRPIGTFIELRIYIFILHMHIEGLTAFA